jgi:hypothetical protein
VTLGIGTLREYVTSVLHVLGQQNGWIYNQSAAGAVNRLLGHSVLAFQASIPILTVLNVVLVVAAMGAVAWLVRPAGAPREVRGAQFGLAILAMLLVGSVTWFWHLGALLIVLGSVVALVASGTIRRPRPVAIAAVAVLVTTGVLAPLFIAWVSMSGLTKLSSTWLWWPALQAVSAPAFATAALFVALALALHRSPRQALG